MIVLDDHHLFAVLTGRESPGLLELRDQSLATTGSWYYRLARAVANGSGDGTLSRRFAALAVEDQARMRSALNELPIEITTLDVREFTPVMAALSSIVNVNFLTAEAVATALILNATIVVSTSSPLLDRAGATAHVRIAVIA